MPSFDPILAVEHCARELALFAAAGFLIGGLDDGLVDLIWIGRALWRHLVVRGGPRADAAPPAPPAPPAKPGRLALFVPAWQEAAVIGAMVETALVRLRHPDWRLYVGCYPNDPDTAAAVIRAAEGDPRIRIVVGDRPGPTTKAGCLNWIWRAMLADEAASGVPVKAVVLHDAEDIVHADELTVFDALIGRFAMVQIPVHALPVRGLGHRAEWISSHYCGEFAEAHGKQLVVREAIGAAVPSAGVGCAIARPVLAAMAGGRDGPFDPDSLTEDYELGLRIGTLGERGTFVRLPAADGQGLVEVRACFPHTLWGSVKQKSRWITGISLAGWDRLGWQGGLAERWMRLRDRCALLAALVLAAAYAALPIWGVAWVAATLVGRPMASGIPPLLVTIDLTLLGWRMAMRAAFTARAHGGRMAAMTPVHMAIGNVVAMLAAWRALILYAGLVRHGRLRWDKTAHIFPATGPAAP